MHTIAKMKNPVQHYAWGSFDFIPDLLGNATPADEPWAELWMGAHPKAPSQVEYDGRWVSLPELIEKFPEQILGKTALKRFGRQLPFLFKVLAADQPLSIQAHPNRDQAVAGFLRENQAGIPLDAPQRNYRDDNHKPECLCALTEFWALNGFRPITDMLAALARACSPELRPELDAFSQQADVGGLRRFFHGLMTLPDARRQRIVEQAVQRAAESAADDPAARWMVELQRWYPGDIGVLGPLLLNLVQLNPGEALFLEAGELHAYLRGCGIELMANSDNVLRGGLTVKHVDVRELLQVARFEPKTPRIIRRETQSFCEAFYPQPAREFMLAVISLAGGRPCECRGGSVAILLCMQGRAAIRAGGDRREIILKRGDAVLVPAAVQRYRLEGEAKLYKAGLPAQTERGTPGHK